MFNKIPKCYKTLVLKMIIYETNCMSQIHLASEIYPYELYGKCALGDKGFIWHFGSKRKKKKFYVGYF